MLSITKPLPEPIFPCHQLDSPEGNFTVHFKNVLENSIHTHMVHDDFIKWKHFPRYWSFVRGIHRSPVNSPHKGHWCGALMFSLISAWINVLSKQWRGGWFETPSCSLWHHCNAFASVCIKAIPSRSIKVSLLPCEKPRLWLLILWWWPWTDKSANQQQNTLLIPSSFNHLTLTNFILLTKIMILQYLQNMFLIHNPYSSA